MFRFPIPLWKLWSAFLTALAAMCASSRAENFTLMVTHSNPLGIGAFVPNEKELDLGIDRNFKGDLSDGIGVLA